MLGFVPQPNLHGLRFLGKTYAVLRREQHRISPHSQFCAIQRQLWQYRKKLKNPLLTLAISKGVFPWQGELSTRGAGLFCTLSLQIGKLKSPKQMVMFIDQTLLFRIYASWLLLYHCASLPLASSAH
jgi:hypothetical protein